MKIVLKYLGYLLLIFSIFPAIPIAAALIYGESFTPFLAPVIISAIIGIWLINLRDKEPRKSSISYFDLPRSISLSALSFITISAIGMTPYLLTGNASPIDSMFESVSGFTTTGLTIFTDVESLPKSLLLWRAETQWIGGLGVIILFLVIVAAMRHQDSLKESTTKARSIANLYQAQGASEKLEANMEKSLRNTIIIYGVYTLLGIVLLAITGLTAFEATALAFTAISTAGFSVTNSFYTYWPVLGVLMLLMIAGATTFVLHNRLFKGYITEIWKNRNFRFFILAITTATILSTIFIKDFKTALFDIVSGFTTTGYRLGDISAMPAVAILIIMCCMMIGGMLGSTSGAIKVDRIRLMLRSIPWMIKKAASPSEAVIPLKIDGKPVDEESIIITQAFITCYILILIIGTGLIMATGESFLDSSFQTVSALGGVGLQTTNIDTFNPIAKAVLMTAMLFGRLEIFPILVLGKLFYEKAVTNMRRREEISRKLFYIVSSRQPLWKRRL